MGKIGDIIRIKTPLGDEVQITKASNVPDNEIIDYALPEINSQVFPKKSLNYLIAKISMVKQLQNYNL